MPEYEIVKIAVAKILLDVDNFRLGNHPNQREVIRSLAEDQQDKLINLAEHIAENGLSPLDKIGVMKNTESDNYSVVEGNRRIFAVKFLNDPDILDGSALESKKPLIKKIITDNTYIPIIEVECVIFDTQEDAYQWMEIKHNGEDEGRGTVPWSAVAKARMESQFGREGDNSEANDILVFLQKNGVEIDAMNYPITNLTRLIKTPSVKSKLGLLRERPLKAICTPRYLLAAMKQITEDLGRSGAVNLIRHKTDRDEYINGFKLKKFKEGTPWIIRDWTSRTATPQPQTPPAPPAPSSEPDDGNPSGGVVAGSSGTGHSSAGASSGGSGSHSAGESSGARSTRSSSNRKKLITSDFVISIPRQEAKINDIYRELKSLDNSQFPYSCAVLFRVFIELSLDYYLTKNNVPFNENTKMVEKLQKVKESMKSQHIMTDRELQPINTMISDPNLPYSTKAFNAYVHNPRAIVINHKSLNNSWDTIGMFIKKIWN